MARAETIERVARVKELVTQGKSIKDAVKEVGVSMGTYYANRKTKSTRTKEKKPDMVFAVETSPRFKAIIVSGSPQEIKALWEQL